MIELIDDRPLLLQVYDCLVFLDKCQDGREFSKQILGRCPGYLTAWKAMKFNPSPQVMQGARTAITVMAEKEQHPGRRLVLYELTTAIDCHLLGKGGDA